MDEIESQQQERVGSDVIPPKPPIVLDHEMICGPLHALKRQRPDVGDLDPRAAQESTRILKLSKAEQVPAHHRSRVLPP